jgi:hypothetical protein
MTYPDSPFQTSLAELLLTFAKKISKLLPQTVKEAIVHLRKWALAQLQPLYSTPWAAVKQFVQSTSTLPRSHKKTYPPESPVLFNDDSFLPPSPAVPALTWVLETSTNPDLISTAAALAVELQ